MLENSIRFVELDEAGSPVVSLSDFSTPSVEYWILLSDRQCQLNPRVAEILARSAAERPDVALFFADEIVIDTSHVGSFYFIYKSEIDVIQLISRDYVGWPLIVKASAFKDLLKYTDYRSGAFCYNLILRALASGHAVGRITEILSARNDRMLRSAASSRQSVLKQWIAEHYPDYELRDGRGATALQLARTFHTHPSVTIIVYSRKSCEQAHSHHLNVSMLLDSLAASHWPMDRLTVIVDADSVAGTAFKASGYPFVVRLVRSAAGVHEHISHSRKLNELSNHAQTEHVVFMDDSLVAVAPDSLAALLTFSMQDDVGAVGVGLLHPDGTISYPGKSKELSASDTSSAPAEADYRTHHLTWAEIHREWSMLTGPLFATRRSALSAVGGFDERFALGLADADLCVRMRVLGLRSVYTPHAEFTLAEDAPTALAERTGSDVALFIQRWRGFISEDPAYHLRLSRSSAFAHPLKAEPPLWVQAPYPGPQRF